MDAHRCHTLAQHGPVRIDLCGCGQVHVSIGPLTVRLGRAAVHALHATLGDAVARLGPLGSDAELH